MKQIVIFTILIASLCSCSKYAYVSLSFPVEPEMSLPDEISEIAIVNRSITPEEMKSGKVMEAVFSAEIGSDFLASDACVKGVYDAIQGLPGVTLKIPEEIRMPGSGTSLVPELLSWEKVEDICRSEEADALLVLESFDSNTDLMAKATYEQLAAIVNTGRPKTTPPSEINMHVSSYWRLYDPEKREIIDQYQHSSFKSFSTRGGVPPPDALPLTAYEAGISYIDRYLYSSYSVRRKLYQRTGGKAKKQFRAGYRNSELANWTGAMELWEGLCESPKDKTAGRACLNMAVANEVLGHTDQALAWAQRSYELHRNKLGRDYSKILRRRKAIEGH